jgi:hypothetical protein
MRSAKVYKANQNHPTQSLKRSRQNVEFNQTKHAALRIYLWNGLTEVESVFFGIFKCSQQMVCRY